LGAVFLQHAELGQLLAGHAPGDGGVGEDLGTFGTAGQPRDVGDAGDVVEIRGMLVLTALGQTITGTFSFTPSSDGFDVSASGVSFLLVSTGGSAPVASLVGGTAELRTTSAGVVGAVT